MTLDYDDFLNSIMASMDRTKQVDVNDIPNIDLYMDQLLTFMDESLRKSARHPGGQAHPWPLHSKRQEVADEINEVINYNNNIKTSNENKP